MFGGSATIIQATPVEWLAKVVKIKAPTEGVGMIGYEEIPSPCSDQKSEITAEKQVRT